MTKKEKVRLLTSTGVYFILNKSRNAVRIGLTHNIKCRLSMHQCHNVDILELVGFLKCKNIKETRLREKELHKRFQKDNIHGSWFNYSFDMKQSILCYKIKPSLKILDFKNIRF